jgi:hypothetical protein
MELQNFSLFREDYLVYAKDGSLGKEAESRPGFSWTKGWILIWFYWSDESFMIELRLGKGFSWI